MKLKKKRSKGVRVKKYPHGGYHGDPPYTAVSDATYVAMPDLSFLPVLQPLPEEQRPVGPTIGPTTQAQITAGSNRYEAERRRREAIERGINPNLAFTMPPGLMGDPQAAAAYQYDNMLTSPIGQIAGEFAFTPIGRGLDYVIPRIPSTYLGRQTGRGVNYLGEKASALGQKAMQFLSDYAMETPGMRVVKSEGIGYNPRTQRLYSEQQLKEGKRAAGDEMTRRQVEVLYTEEGQRRLRQQIADDLTLFATNRGMLGPTYSGDFLVQRSQQKVLDAMSDGVLDPNSPLVTKELEKALAKIESAIYSPSDVPYFRNAVGVPIEDLMALDARLAEISPRLEEISKREAVIYDKLDQMDKTGANVFSPEYKKLTDELDALDAEVGPLIDERRVIKEQLKKETDVLETGASYNYDTNQITIGSEFYVDPQFAREIVGHEFRHLLQMAPKSRSEIFYSLPLQARRAFSKVDQDLGKLDLVNISELKGLTPEQITGLNQAKDYFLRGPQRSPAPIERTAMLDELRTAMVYSNVIPDRYATITAADVADMRKLYGAQYPMSERAAANAPQRIIELSKDTEANNQLLADIMNRLPIIAFGAAGAAAAQEYGYGGKYKIKKKRKSGYRTV